MHRKAGLVLGVLCLFGCSKLWAELRAAEMMEGLGATPAYRGESVERGMLPGRPDELLVRALVFQPPFKIRSEVTAPRDRAGDTVVYDGSTVSYWWPAEGLGVRVRGVHPADEKALRAYVKDLVTAALRDYAWSLPESPAFLGQPTDHWKILPLQKAPYRMLHDEWRHKKYQFPLKLQYWEPANTLWYSFEFTRFDPAAAVSDADFQFQYPPNAYVLDWDLDAPGLTLEEARKQMNFPVRVPKKLPPGHKLVKLVKANTDLPMVTLIMNSGARWLTLAENRHMGAPGYTLPVGKRVSIRGNPAAINFFGANTSVYWVQDGTALSLTSNLSLEEILAVAESVE